MCNCGAWARCGMSRARTPLLAARLLQQCSGSACRAALDSAWSAALLNDVLAQSALLCCGAAARPAPVDSLFSLQGQLQLVGHSKGARQSSRLNGKRLPAAHVQTLCCVITGSQADE